MHNNTQTPEDIRGYSIYGVYAKSENGRIHSNSVLEFRDADRAYIEYLHKMKVSKLHTVVLDGWNDDGTGDHILRSEPTAYALKKGVKQ